MVEVVINCDLFFVYLVDSDYFIRLFSRLVVAVVSLLGLFLKSGLSQDLVKIFILTFVIIS